MHDTLHIGGPVKMQPPLGVVPTAPNIRREVHFIPLFVRLYAFCFCIPCLQLLRGRLINDRQLVGIVDKIFLPSPKTTKSAQGLGDRALDISQCVENGKPIWMVGGLSEVLFLVFPRSGQIRCNCECTIKRVCARDRREFLARMWCRMLLLRMAFFFFFASCL